MKKTLKVLLIAAIAFSVLFGFSQPISLAKEDPSTILTNLNTAGNAANTSEVNKVGGTIINWIWAISIVIAVVVLMITGLKFIMGSTQEKAEYKKSLIPLVVGVLILVFATTIVKILFSM